MPTFNVFSLVDDKEDTWRFRGTTMADNAIEAIDRLAKTDAGKNGLQAGDIRKYAAIRSSYWETHDFKFEVTPHRVLKNEALDNDEEPAKV